MTEAEIGSIVDYISRAAKTVQSDSDMDVLADACISINDVLRIMPCMDKSRSRRLAESLGCLYTASGTLDSRSLFRRYRLVKDRAGAVYGCLDEECSSLFCRIIDGRVISRDMDGIGWDAYVGGYLREDMDIIHCIIYEFGDKAGEDDSCVLYMDFCRKVFSLWEKALANGCGWSNVAVESAVEMLGLIQDYYCIFFDEAFNPMAVKAYGYYIGNLEQMLTYRECISPADVPVLAEWHRLLGESVIYPVHRDMQLSVAAALEATMEKGVKYSGAWLMAASRLAVQQGSQDCIVTESVA